MYFGVVHSKVTFRWGLEELRLLEVKASVENVVSEDEVSTKTASLERKIGSVGEVVLRMTAPFLAFAIRVVEPWSRLSSFFAEAPSAFKERLDNC